MRTNLPVVDEEFVLDNLQSIVSKTDLKGRIVYVNPYFIEVSGFTHDELLGAPHNLVRHPDMPAAAFADLWSTLRAGLPWNGLVKNRRKDGRYYWVMANVTPLLEQGRAVGYVSVRTKPSSDQVQAAQALYARLASGSCALHRGQMVRTGLAGRFDALLAMAPARRLDLGMAALLVLLIGSSAPVSQLLLERQAPGLAASVLTAAGVVLIVSLWRSLHAGVVEPGQQAVDALNGLAGGDLAAGNDGEHGNISHLQRALRQLKVNLRSIIGDVRANVNAINQVASEIACGNANLYQRTESQASNLQQTASTMEQFSSTLRQNAASVMQAEQLVRAASDVAGQGGEVVARVGVRMGEINASATKIVDIIALIDSIAFQTNILALNAAVEAARAGEQGRGFAVVASEVRNLAQRSAAAAREIKSLIVASVDIIGSGNALVEQAGNTMDQVVQSVGRATDIMREIAIATAEQSSAIGQVSSAIGHMDELTQKNAVLVEQSAAAAKSLEAQTQGLVEAISLFKLDHPAGAGRRAGA